MIAFYLHSERKVDLEDMDMDDIEIDDIAHALANINRFNGMTRYPVSVAQHSVYVSHLCNNANALQGLLHDASEAYLGDMTYFLKQSSGLGYYRELERKIQSLIFKKFGCDLELALDVNKADVLMLRYEAARSFKKFILNCSMTKTEIERIGIWKPWKEWETSKARFLIKFWELYKPRR